MNPLWNEIAARSGVTLTPEQHALLSRYLDLLFEANATMNLTRIPDRAAGEVQHVADSLTVLPFLPSGAFSLADVGSGGGAPGIPLAIALPAARVLLIESTRKKAAFLERAVAELGLPNVTVAGERAEEVANSDCRESFDVAVARAVATMNWLAEWCLPLVKKGGKMLAMKGPRVAEELPGAGHAIRILGGGSADVRPVELPGAENHVIVEIRKVGKTPVKYPRPATQAKGKPLQ